MPRLRNADTGVVINVSDEKAARLGNRFSPVEPAVKEAPASKAATSSKSKK